MLSADLDARAVAHHEDRLAKGLPAEHAISAASLVGQPIEIILERARDALGHSVIRTTTVGKLLDAGWGVRLTDEATAHADLVLPSPPNEQLWEALRAMFDPEQPNPVRRPKGGRA